MNAIVSSSTIGFKNLKVLASMFVVAWHPKLIELLLWIRVRYQKIVVTQGYEKRDYPSVHSVKPLRGLDIRSWVFVNPQEVVDEINKDWMYDSSRPGKVVATYHNVGRGKHIHLQVHKNTRRRKNEVT